MNERDLATLIRFTFWADRRLLAACDRLTPDEFTRDLTPDPGWGSLRGVLVHLLDTAYGWRSILQGQKPATILEASDFADVAALKARWEVEEAAWLDYVASLSGERIDQGQGDDAPDGLALWQTIMHVVIHGIQHRSEAAFILTGLGQSPGELDFDLFVQAHPGPARD